MSVPAAKALSPAPVMTSALTSRVMAIRPQISAKPSYIAKVRALRGLRPVEGDPADLAALVEEQFLGHFRAFMALERLLKGFADFRLGYYREHLDLFEKLATERPVAQDPDRRPAPMPASIRAF